MSPEENQKTVLEAAVHQVTGREDLTPRESQARLSTWITEAMSGTGEKHLASRAPTGTGKGLAYLAPAMERAVKGQRTLISTEGLGLQRQLIEKDAPAVAAATKEVHGRSITTEVLKGFSNYVCGIKTRTTAKRLLGLANHPSDEQILSALEEMRQSRNPSDPVRIAGVVSTIGTMVALISWALETEGGGAKPDRDSCPAALAGAEWSLVSIPATDCKGDDCPLFEYCAPQNARRDAGEADIVVTNHTMLAIQATKKIPVVIGSPSLGDFSHIVVDEAHALPTIVRSHGAVEISGPRIERAMRKVEQAGGSDTVPRHIADQIEKVTQVTGFCMKETEALLGKARDGEEVRLGASDEMTVFEALAGSISTLREIVAKESTIEDDERREVANWLENLAGDVRGVAHEVKNVARWAVRDTLASGDVITKMCASPVDVSSNLYFNVWTTEGAADAEDTEQLGTLHTQRDQAEDSEERAFYTYEIERIEAQTENTPRRELSVSAVSATLSPSFAREAGLHCAIRDVPTPFADAYSQSALYIPLPGADDLDELTTEIYGKQKMDTKAHPDWCLEHIAELVYANTGSAMVVSATAAAGKKYADALRADPTLRFQVYTQWDPIGRVRAIDAWKADESAVIVGTKSIMTGVDAPGETNSLVIIDRPARSPLNPVDKARVDALIDEGRNRFEADTKVYVEDAAVLLEQSSGRLIRSNDDRGMVVVLDPRLDVDSPIKYPALTRKTYMRPLNVYGQVYDNLDEALDWLEDRKNSLQPTAAPDTLEPAVH